MDANDQGSIFKLHPDGRLEAFGLRVIFFRIETRATLRATLLDVLGLQGGAVILRIIGEKIGRLSGEFALKRGLVQGLEEKTFRFLSNVYLQSGRGKREYSLENDKLIVRIFNSFEADAHRITFGQAKEPSCFFIQGYLRGFFGIILNKDVNVEETKCKAKGDEYCEFIVHLRSSPVFIQ